MNLLRFVLFGVVEPSDSAALHTSPDPVSSRLALDLPSLSGKEVNDLGLGCSPFLYSTP